MTQNLASLAVVLSTSTALSIVFKATVIVSAGLLLTKAMRATRASRRFVVLAWTFAVLSAVPIGVAFAPAIPLVVREIRYTHPPASIERPPAGSVVEPRYPSSPHGAATGQSTGSVGIGTWLVMAWALGAVISLVPVVMTVMRLNAL